MSYTAVLRALEKGDIVTFNDSGGANATETPELVVDHVTGDGADPVVHLRSHTGEQGVVQWMVYGEEGDELAIRHDPEETGAYRFYDVVETIELIATT